MLNQEAVNWLNKQAVKMSDEERESEKTNSRKIHKKEQQDETKLNNTLADTLCNYIR